MFNCILGNLYQFSYEVEVNVLREGRFHNNWSWYKVPSFDFLREKVLNVQSTC